MKTTTGSAKHSLSKRTVCLSLTAALAVSAFAGMGALSLTASATPSEEYGLVDNIQDGVILHCFDWKYSDITDSLQQIAKAGFSAVQTSPVQPAAGTGPWYWLYQPLSFTVAENGDLGTRAELQELCEKAEEFGIKVIVDVVANHLAGDHTNIQEDLVADEYWHDDGDNINYKNRYSITHGALGMPDLNSENAYVQQVVADFVDDLKSLGVDGVRWDAAKHIGLPSEDCAFWSAVTANGLYHYGEILDGPVSTGGEDLMKEYTDYISVTDNTYATMLNGSFKNGKAPAKGGNWTTEGISADKIVYWGESHDNYSNGEGKGTNSYSQNVIDRAYAVAAARADATALYLSRPYAIAQDSIRVGVKGSMHFTSPEVAAVNHFHNAMVGKEDAYAASENCAVVTRKDGGAVIVCGEGSGAVSVENVNGYVPAGTYFDEVTGNEFTVTESTISGTVGESGIAVVYDSAFLSKVYAEPEADTEFTDTLNVTLHAVAAQGCSYQVIVDGDNTIYQYGDFQDGDVITIGEGIAAPADVYLLLSGIDENDNTVSSSYHYKKLENRTIPAVENGGIVFDNSKAQWDTINIYVYDESGAVTITNGQWPGVAMTDCGEDYYSYQLPEQFASCKHIMIIFNNGNGDQIPGAMQDGMTMAYADKKLYDGTKWMNYPGYTPSDEPDPEPVDEPDKQEPSRYSIIGSFNNWTGDVPMYEMTKMDLAGTYVGYIDGLPAGDYEFKVRADKAWDESWGAYEADFDRTLDSQQNCTVTVGEGERLVVMLNTTLFTPEALLNPDSLIYDPNTTSDDLINLWPVLSYTFVPQTEHTFGLIGDFNSWSKDIPMEDTYGIGVYTATVEGLTPGETYTFKVRADGAWDLSWGVYEPDFDRTQNSQTNCSVTVDANAKSAKLMVALSTVSVDEAAQNNPDSFVNDPGFTDADMIDFWPVGSNLIMDMGGDDPTPSEPSQESSEPSEQSSEPSQQSEPSEVSEPSEQSTEPTSSEPTSSAPTSQPSQTSTITPGSENVKTADSTSAWVMVLMLIGSAAAVTFVLTAKKRS